MRACDPAPHPDHRSPLWAAFSWSFIALSVAYATALLMLLPESNDCRYAASANGDMTDTGYDVFPPDQWCEYEDTGQVSKVSSAPAWVPPVLWTATALTVLFAVWALADQRLGGRSRDPDRPASDGA